MPLSRISARNFLNHHRHTIRFGDSRVTECLEGGRLLPGETLFVSGPDSFDCMRFIISCMQCQQYEMTSQSMGGVFWLNDLIESLAILDSLCVKPAVVILDFPLSVLGDFRIKTLEDLLERLCHAKTTIITNCVPLERVATQRIVFAGDGAVFKR